MKFVLLKYKMVSYTRVLHGQIEPLPVQFQDEQNNDLDSVEKMDDLEAPIVCGEGSWCWGTSTPPRDYKKPKFAVERDSKQVQQKEETTQISHE